MIAGRAAIAGMLAIAALIICGPARSTALADAARIGAARARLQNDDLRRHIAVLASDSFEGRGAGTAGGQVAGAYVVKVLREIGVEPLDPRAGHFQEFGGKYRNIVGVVGGDDKQFSNECIVVCAHYDHVGYGSRRNSFGPIGVVHNGADDNASGTAALLEIAEAFVAEKLPLRRRIIFAFFDGEEIGLLGSKHWVDNAPIPIEHVKLAVNVDMIGRLKSDRLTLYGSRSGVDLRRMTASQNRSPTLMIDYNWDILSDSDHYSFFEKKIPILMFHTGKHAEYHTPRDDPETINLEGLAEVSRYLFDLLNYTANASSLPTFRPKGIREDEKIRKRRETPRPSLDSRLGLSWRVSDEPGPLQITRIANRSPAQAAGLRVGETIIEFAGVPAAEIEDFRQFVMACPVDVTATIGAAGNETTREVAIRLEGPSQRIGISWSIDDDAEPGTAFVTRVTTGTAADQSGLRVGDRVYRVDEKTFETNDDLVELFLTERKSTTLVVERDGRVRNVTLELPPLILPAGEGADVSGDAADVAN